ncbi:hypothetical protein V1477_002899 [Vespula maculifrons]|uniref:Uncharacterized protein n=1 Tax=Vespula maculifrons TaxID=7453 RepID=A0ABD2CUZ3_VESMC
MSQAIYPVAKLYASNNDQLPTSNKTSQDRLPAATATAAAVTAVTAVATDTAILPVLLVAHPFWFIDPSRREFSNNSRNEDDKKE